MTEFTLWDLAGLVGDAPKAPSVLLRFLMSHFLTQRGSNFESGII